jgi:hypothetical protein
VTVFKQADDKQPQIDALTRLLERPHLDRRTRTAIDDEIWAIRVGARGEREAAYEIDFGYADSPNFAVIHDLRLEVKGRVAQIDHLILNRVMDAWVCETKAFSEGVRIDDRGHWYRYAGRKTYGMPSPVHQNANHVEVLKDLVDSGAIALPRRVVTLKPAWYPVVLVSNGAKIDIPKTAAARRSIDGLDTVIKVEELRDRIYNSYDDTMRTLRALPKLVGAEAISDIARQLVALHRPATFDWAAKFGLSRKPTTTTAETTAPVPATAPPSLAGKTCVNCGVTVTPKVAAFSLDNRELFGGRVFCYDCQRKERRRLRRAAL